MGARSGSTGLNREMDRMDAQVCPASLPPQLAIVIPAWNERENIELLLPALKEVIGELGLKAEIVVVDGGSHDGTREAAERRGARPVLQQEQGYGGALLAGFAATTA